MKSEIRFAEIKVKEALHKLKNSKAEDKHLYEWISRALDDLENDAYCGIQIPKRLIPKEYIRGYGITNLWKYNLPNAWRLIYSVAKEEVIVISIIIEWLNHKKYERRFRY